MSKQQQRDQGSVHVIITGVLIAALIGALGFIFWQNFINKPQLATGVMNDSTSTVTKSNTSSSSSPSETAKEGVITGSLTYPSEGIPASLEVHATNLDTNKEYTTNAHISSAIYKYGVGYRLSVPAGRYHVYGTLDDMPGEKAYYDKFITCGMYASCKDYSKIEVIVEAEKDTDDVMVGDWYNT